MRTPLPPVAAVTGFIDAINSGDVDRLVALMSPDHRLQVLREPALVGQEANGALAARPGHPHPATAAIAWGLQRAWLHWHLRRRMPCPAR